MFCNILFRNQDISFAFLFHFKLTAKTFKKSRNQMDTIMYLHGKQCIIKYFILIFSNDRKKRKEHTHVEDVKLKSATLVKAPTFSRVWIHKINIDWVRKGWANYEVPAIPLQFSPHNVEPLLLYDSLWFGHGREIWI